MYRILAALLMSLITSTVSIYAQNDTVGVNIPATFPLVSTTKYADDDSIKNGSFLSRLLATITEGNIDRTHEKPIDMSFAIYPSYSHEPGFGIGGAMTALYRIDRKDTIMVPSDLFLSVNASLRGFFQIYIKGNNLFPDRRSRLNYLVELYRMPLRFWGITSEATAHNPMSKYDRCMADFQVNFSHEVIDNLYLGVRMRNNFTAAKDIRNPEYLLGERHQYYVTGFGASIEYDNRDNLLSPTRGVHLLYRPTFYWKALGSAPASFWNHTFIANAYTRLWQDAVLAFDLYGSFNSKYTPWTMREMIASDGIRMRGYYMGSYIDNCQIALQAEYRQHLYKRLGFTLWGGCATIFNTPSEFSKKDIHPQWLPNFGIGMRFEIKHNANLRLDYGFGRHDSGLIFAFGEAF